MHADADIRITVQRQLWRAVLLRRAPAWAFALAPVLILLAYLFARAAPLSLKFVALALLLAGAAWCVFDILGMRSRVASEWPRWLDAAIPALEDSSALLITEAASPIAQLQRKRLQSRLLAVLRKDDYRAIARARIAVPMLPLIAAILAAGATFAWPQLRSPVPHAAAAAVTATVPGAIVLRVTPPTYTGAASYETTPRDIQVPQHSDIRWCFQREDARPVTIEMSDGRVLELGSECAAFTATESLFWRVRGQGAGDGRYNVRVIADQPPEVAITAPTEAVQVLAAGAQSVQLSVATRDDYGISRASLHMTLARGSGENIRFSDREMPLPQSSDPHVRNWQKNWQLSELGMEPGDELYFFVRATDNAPEHPHTVQSPTYTLRLPGPEAESLETSALPTMVKPESLRSQRQIIIDTEQLVADMPGLSSSVLRARSESIAGDQSSLRLRYGQFLGEESSLFGDEHGHEEGHGKEKEHASAGIGTTSMSSIVAQFGHAHDEQDNATIFDPKTKEVLRRALKAMWEAEKFLRALTPKGALPSEYKALDAIKELQQAERVYLHRTAFVPPAIKEEKRMSGDVVGAQSYKRAQGQGSDAVPQDVRELVRALASDGALPALWSKTARDIIAARIAGDERKLAAQRAVQDVADGCANCRAVLRAYLRGSVSDAPVVLQARPQTDSKFRQAWRGKEQP
jgi:hypothetical protein